MIKTYRQQYLTVTIHRTENIYNKKRLKSLVNLLIKLKNENLYSEIEWYCHDITINALERNNLITTLNNNDVRLNKLILHDNFINKIYSSKAVITDGGSIAEEVNNELKNRDLERCCRKQRIFK